MTRLDHSWADDRRYVQIKNGELTITEDAPKEVKDAYKRYLKQVEEARKRGTL